MSKRKVAEIFQSMDYGPAPESSDNAQAWLATHNRTFGFFINNNFVQPKGRTMYKSVDPCTGKTLAETAMAEKSDVDDAVKAARAAFDGWSKTPGHARARHLYAIARCINKHARLFAVLESMDNGKTIRETRDCDLALVIRHFYHHAGWAQLAETEMKGYAPVGVIGQAREPAAREPAAREPASAAPTCAQVIPWNFPLLMLAWKIAPALAMGNTIVLKPAPYTSLSALLFAQARATWTPTRPAPARPSAARSCARPASQVVAEAGVPPGVINIIPGEGAVGGYLCTHPGIDKVRH